QMRRRCRLPAQHCQRQSWTRSKTYYQPRRMRRSSDPKATDTPPVELDASISKTYITAIRAYIFDCIGLVVNGGQNMWVTKNLVGGEVEYKLIKCNSNPEKNLM